MKKATIALSCTTLFLAFAGFTTPGICQGFQQPKFGLIESPNLPWDQAKADAESRGGHLATLATEAEWQALIDLLGSRMWGKIWWLGATDSAQEGLWKWITGESLTNSHWAAGEPSGAGVNGEEDYLAVMNNWTWNDAGNTATPISGYVIEYEPRCTLIKAVKPFFTGLAVGTNYQLQVSSDLSHWTNHGSTFVATTVSKEIPEYWDTQNWAALFFRLIPVTQ